MTAEALEAFNQMQLGIKTKSAPECLNQAANVMFLCCLICCKVDLLKVVPLQFVGMSIQWGRLLLPELFCLLITAWGSEMLISDFELVWSVGSAVWSADALLSELAHCVWLGGGASVWFGWMRVC